MNKKRILELADKIDGLPLPNDPETYKSSFDMGVVSHRCGSPSCIAGQALHMFDDIGKPDGYRMMAACECLGLEPDAGNALFAPNNDYACFDARIGEPGFVTPKHAAAVLRNLAETGEVDWTVGAGS